MYFSLKKINPPVDVKHKKKKTKQKENRLIEAESIYKNIALEKGKK